MPKREQKLTKLKKMIREHLNEKDQPKMAFDSFEEALGYINIHHLKKVAPYKCLTCGKYHFGHSSLDDERSRRHVMEMNEISKEVSSLMEEIKRLKKVISEKDVEINKLKVRNENLSTLLDENSLVLNKWAQAYPADGLYKITQEISDKWKIKYLKSLLPKRLGNAHLYVFGRENCYRCVYKNKATGSFEIDTGWKSSKVEALQCMVDGWNRVKEKYGSQE